MDVARIYVCPTEMSSVTLQDGSHFERDIVVECAETIQCLLAGCAQMVDSIHEKRMYQVGLTEA